MFKLFETLFSGGASTLVDSVGKVIDNVVTTKGEKMEIENEMKKAEMDYQLEVSKLTLQEKQIYLQDVDSARKRESEVQTSQYATKISKNVSPFLAIGTTILTFALFYILVFDPSRLQEGSSKEIVLYILGVLSAILTQIFSYYFGSSMGSAEKTRLIEKQLDANAAQ